jgi:hypothetical protein
MEEGYIAVEKCLSHDNLEVEKVPERKRSGQDKPFQGTPPMTYFFQEGPSS